MVLGLVHVACSGYSSSRYNDKGHLEPKEIDDFAKLIFFINRTSHPLSGQSFSQFDNFSEHKREYLKAKLHPFFVQSLLCASSLHERDHVGS